MQPGSLLVDALAEQLGELARRAEEARQAILGTPRGPVPRAEVLLALLAVEEALALTGAAVRALQAAAPNCVPVLGPEIRPEP